MLKKRMGFRAGLAAIAAGTLLLSGCATGGTSGGSDGGGEGDEFRIAAGLALTGGFAAFDEPALAGIQIAVDEINEAGGIAGKYPIVLDIADIRSDPGEAVVTTRELVSKSPNVLIAACMTDAAIPQGAIGTENQIPTFSTCATASTLTESGGDYMFGNFPPDTFESTAMATYALEQGFKTAFVISSPESSYTENAPKAFAAAFEAGGGEVVGQEVFSFNQQDYSPIVSAIKRLNPAPDVIQTGMFEPAFPAFMKQLRAAGVEIPVYGTAGIDTPSVAAAGSDVEGVMLPSVGVESESPELKAFNDKLRETKGPETVTSYATRGYDLIKIIEAAVIAADSTDPVKLRDAILGLKDVQGLSTTTSYDYPGANRLPLIQPTYIVEITNSERVLRDELVLDPTLVPKL